jgi:hypothetical protein
MANLILIAGDTGTGKTTSMEKLNPDSTFLINCANKPLPFRGSDNLYKVGKNLYYSHTSADITGAMTAVNSNKAIKTLVIDDSNFVMTEYFFEKSSETGYTKFTELARNFQAILSKAKSMRDDLNVVVIMHTENEVSNGIILGKKIKTVGKLVDDQYQPLAVVTIALFTHITYDKSGLPVYEFITQRCKKDGIEIPAKSPRGMFPLTIPNDLEQVIKLSREYYSTVAPQEAPVVATP